MRAKGMPSSWDRVVTATLLACALLTTGLVVQRELRSRAAASAAAVAQKPVFIANWRSHLHQGIRLGAADAPVQLVEFADFECPACASFHYVLRDMRKRYPTQVALTFIHYPVPGHRMAEPAARAAECAAQQSRFEPMHDQLFEHQSELGLKAWSAIAAEARIPSIPAFESCMQQATPMFRIIEGKKLGDQINVYGTPTLLVNGWKLSSPPSAEQLREMIEAVLAGKNPV